MTATPSRAKAKKRTFAFIGNGHNLTLQAYTRGEARALAKQAMGIKPKDRLPQSVQIKELKR